MVLTVRDISRAVDVTIHYDVIDIIVKLYTCLFIANDNDNCY